MGIFQKRGKWFIDYYVDGKRKRECIGNSKTLAKKALEVRRAEIVQGIFKIKNNDQDLRFEELAEKYLEYVRGYKKAPQSDEYSIKNMMKHFGGFPLSKISSFLIEKYKLERKKVVKPASINRELACLKHMFNLAIKWEYTDVNPMKDVKLFKENNERVRFLSADEESRLLHVCPKHIKPIVIFALNSGMRRGEIFNLEWKDVDLLNRIVTIRETKNNEIRKIPINDEALDVLKDIKKNKKSDIVFANRYRKKYVDIKKSFHTALKKAEIYDFTFHDLRHSFASNLIMTGTDLVTVKELLGHKTIKMTMRYSHLSQDHKMQAVQRLKKKPSQDGHHTDTMSKMEVVNE